MKTQLLCMLLGFIEASFRHLHEEFSFEMKVIPKLG